MEPLATRVKYQDGLAPGFRILSPVGPLRPLEFVPSEPRGCTARGYAANADNVVNVGSAATGWATTGRCGQRVGLSPWRSRGARGAMAMLLAALALLQILDLASTLLLLSIGGTEMNPVSAWLLGHGVWAFVAVKLLIAGALLAVIPWVLHVRRRQGIRTALWACAGLDGVYALVVASNLLQFALFA